eukprot:gene51447-70041_t
MIFPLVNLAVALGLGLLIGLERERHKGTGPRRGVAGGEADSLVQVEGQRMRSGLAIRTDIEVEALRRHARLEADGRVAARLLAIANALTGMSRKAAAEAAGMDRQ